jgi:1-deoxy-D-xylulose-5-phosphate synthase
VTPLEIGRGEKLRDGGHGVLVAIGSGVPAALGAAELLAGEGIAMAVVDARFVKPLDAELLTAEALRTGRVVTLEENALMGGFGSAVTELLTGQGVNVPVLRIGLPDRFVEQGSQGELRQRYALDAAGVAGRVRAFLAG